MWILRGGEPVLWTVPVYVKWITEEWGTLFYALPLLAKQQEAVDAVLAKFATPAKGMWEVRKIALERFATLSAGGDPQTFFSWERPRLVRQSQVAKEERKEITEFLDALYQAGVGKSREEVEYWWLQFCNHALDWLLNKEKPVDMYFLRLHNCPYRQNWRQAILSRFQKVGKLLAHSRGKDREFYAVRSGVTDELLCLDLLAMHRTDGICYRHVEVEHRPRWWKAVLRVERERMVRLGYIGYASYFMASVRRRLATTIGIYVDWLAAIARPSAADVESGRQGEFRLVPNVPPSDLPHHWAKSEPVPIVVPNSLPKYLPPSKPADLYPAHEMLPKVPAVQPPTQDVRERRPDLHRPPDGVARKDGMLVLPAYQEPPSGQLLGVQRNGGEKGMAGEPKLETAQ